MTEDLRRLLNIMGDWLLFQGLGREHLLRYESVIALLGADDDQAERLTFALALALGVESHLLARYLTTVVGGQALESLLEKCRFVEHPYNC